MEIHHLLTPGAILLGTGTQCSLIYMGLKRMKEGNENRGKELNIQKAQLDTLIELNIETSKALQKSADALSVVLEKVSSK